MISLQGWLIGLGMVAVVYGFHQWQYWRLLNRHKKMEQDNEKLLARLKKMENQYEFLSKGSVGFGQRLMSSEKRLNQILEKQDEFSSSHASHLLQKQTEKLLKGRVVEASSEGMFTRSEEKLMALVGKNSS